MFLGLGFGFVGLRWWSNQDSKYYTMMRTHAPGMHRASFGFLDGSVKVSWSERRTALHYRMGTLYNGKMAHRFGLAKNTKCAAGCGANDGIEHAISGCKLMEDVRTRRHNLAGAIIARALQHNSIGAVIHSMDVGKDGTAAVLRLKGWDASRRIPAAIGPRLLPKVDPQKDPDTYERIQSLAKRRPDISLVQKHPDGTTTIHLVEIKFTRDTARERQEKRAKAQYTDLLAALAKKPRQRVRMHTVVLGVRGAIFRDVGDLLEFFGFRV